MDRAAGPPAVDWAADRRAVGPRAVDWAVGRRAAGLLLAKPVRLTILMGDESRRT